jgi:membrane-associated phospholipid phosphatase
VSWAASRLEEAAQDVTALGNPAILFVILVAVRSDWWLRAAAGLAAIEIVGRLIKIVFFTHRPRPSAYGSLVEKSDAGSFPSLHAARSAFVFLTLLPSTDRILLRTIFVAVPILVALTRVILGKHRWWDVAAGLAFGAGLALSAAFW